MNSEQIKAMDAEYILPTYARFDVCLTEAKGSWAQDPEGKKYLDFGSGIGVNSLGWCDDEWSAAVAQQAARLQHTSNLYYTQPAAELAKILCSRTGMSKIFFCNSGAEANEGAIKAARKHFSGSHPQRSTIISLIDSFHGRTMATLSATGQKHFHQYFDPFLPGFKHIEAGDLQALEQAMTPDVCAVMLEPIQGEGGVLPLETGYLQAVRHICDQHGALLIADEIQTGVGRTGRFIACEHSGIQPDILTLAKGLGGGLPIGAVLLAKSCDQALTLGDHGSTFGGNPVSCAGANVVMRRLDAKFMQQVEIKGEQLRNQLAQLPEVEKVEGAGLMLGVTLTAPLLATDLVNQAMQNGLLCLTAKQKLRLLPPLTITQQEIQEGISILKTSLQQLKN